MTNYNPISVVKAPGAEDLFKALRYKDKVSLTLVDGRKFEVFVNTIAAFDETTRDRHEWLVNLFDPKSTLGASMLFGFIDTWVREKSYVQLDENQIAI